MIICVMKKLSALNTFCNEKPQSDNTKTNNFLQINLLLRMFSPTIVNEIS